MTTWLLGKHTEDERLRLKEAHELKNTWCDYVMKIPSVSPSSHVGDILSYC
jgi:hypothetical protein